MSATLTHPPSHLSPLLARASFAAPVTTDGEFMWMPAGLQSIHAWQGGKQVSVNVMVDRAAAEAIQAQFAAINGRGQQKVYFDFDHDDKQASFWPTAFTWREGSGIWARGEWSADGLSAIQGKTYRCFSPVFHVDNPRSNPARIVMNPQAALNMGGLVNNPAFKNNLPLWAKHAGSPSKATNQHHNMPPKTKPELEAEIQQINTDLADLRGRTLTPEVQDAITAKDSELQLLSANLEAAIQKERADNLEREQQSIRAADAQKAVADAIARGSIAPKDEEMKSHWLRKITADPTEAKILAAMPGRITLGGPSRPISARGEALTGRVQMVRADARNVLQTMGGICARQAPNSGVGYADRRAVAKEFAAIYASEIKPRLLEGDDIPFAILGAASNSLGTLAQTLVATRTLELLTQELPVLRSVATDMSDEIVSYGDSLKTRIVGIPEVKTYSESTGWATPSNSTTTDVSITYNQFKGVPIQFLGHELAGTVRRLFDELAPAQAWALGDDMVDYVLALITTTAFTNTPESVAAGTFARRNVINMGTALRRRGVPGGPMNRTLLLNSDYFGALGSDNAIVTLAGNNPQFAGVITDGILPNVHGFKVVDVPTMPATAVTGGTLAGIGMSRSALVLATRLSADYVNAIPGAGNGNLTVVTTPAGFSANLVQFVDHTGATANSRLEVIYGASAGQNNAGQLLITP